MVLHFLHSLFAKCFVRLFVASSISIEANEFMNVVTLSFKIKLLNSCFVISIETYWNISLRRNSIVK